MKEGFVYFHDRLKDMITTGDLNVYTQEVELVLLKHPAVREAGVIGLPSEAWGEEVTAVVVLRYEEMPINYSGETLKRELRARLGR